MNSGNKILRNFKNFLTTIALLSLFLVGAVASFAATYTLAPWAYDPQNSGGVISQVSSDGSLYLEKNTFSSPNAAAGAAINNVEGMSTDDLTFSYQIEGYCTPSAPRLNMYLANGQTVSLNCTYGQRGDGYVSFTAGNSYGGVIFPVNQTVKGIDIILDKEGKTILSNITINGVSVTVTPKTLQDQCKNGGWKTFKTVEFKNQQECINTFNS